MSQIAEDKTTFLSRQWKPYPSYQPSGVEWLGEVPNHWQVQKLKYSSYLKGRIGWQNLRSDEFTDEGPYLITGMHFKDGAVDWDACYHITQERYDMAPEIHVKEHDILITKDGSIGKLAYIDYLPDLASLNSHLLLIRPTQKQYLSKYLYYLLGSAAFEVYTLNEQKGTTFYGISQHSIANFPAIFPSLEEQKQIARFLDRETTRIDTLITKKRQLVSLLQKKRDVIIHQATTRGIDIGVPMQDSGIPWIGKIPKHWNILQFKWMSILQRGADITKDIQTEGDVPVVSSGGISSYHNVAIAKSPGVVIGRKGTLGKVYYLDQDYWAHDTTLYISEFYDNYPRFVYYKLQSMELENWDTGSANPTLNRNLIHPLKVSLPSKSEQISVANFLDVETQDIDQAIKKIQLSIDFFEKYRQSLITAAVTGKIDVREGVN